MVKLKFPNSTDITTIEDAEVHRERLNIFHVTIPFDSTPSRKDLEGVKIWIDDRPSISVGIEAMAGRGMKTYVTFYILLKL